MENNKKVGVYGIKNIVNNKIYIGISKDILKRWNRHKNNLKNNKHINDHLQSSWNAYGEQCFSFYVIEECDVSLIEEREIYYINKFKTNDRSYGFNKTSGGDGVRNLSPECCDKISIGESMYPVVQLDLNGNYIKTHRNCNKAATDVKAEAENIRLCCNNFKNLKGRKSCGGFRWMYDSDYQKYGFLKYMCKIRGKGLPLIQYDLKGNIIGIYSSAYECATTTGIGHKLISRVCLNQRPHTCGYIFKRIDDNAYIEYLKTKK